MGIVSLYGGIGGLKGFRGLLVFSKSFSAPKPKAVPVANPPKNSKDPGIALFSFAADIDQVYFRLSAQYSIKPIPCQL